MSSLRVVFAGTPEFGLPCLEVLSNTHEIIAVYTQPDRPSGRGRKLEPSPVKAWALAHGISIYQPLNFKSEEAFAEIAALKPDVIVVVAYGLILPKHVLSLPRLGCINVHASLLPRWRGASPIQQAILHGDNETGVTIMQMDVGLDTGAMLAKAYCPIAFDDTAASLHHKLSQLSVEPLLNTLSNLAAGKAVFEAQSDVLATYAGKIKKEDALIDWHKPAKEINQQIRAFNPWPIAYTRVNDEIMRIYRAQIVKIETSTKPGTILALDKKGLLIATSDAALLIEHIQFPGAKAMAVADWLNAKRSQLYVGLVLQ